MIYILRQMRAYKEKIEIIKNLSYDKDLSSKERKVIESLVGNIGNAKTLAKVRKKIIRDIASEIVYDRRLDGKGYIVRYFDGSEHAVFTDEERNRRSVKDCFFMNVPPVYPWRITEYTGPKTVSETVEYVKRELSHVVLDNINWCKRLGNLYGIYVMEE